MYLLIGMLLSVLCIVVWIVVVYVNTKSFLEDQYRCSLGRWSWDTLDIELTILLSLAWSIIILTMFILWPVFLLIGIVVFIMSTKKEKTPP